MKTSQLYNQGIFHNTLPEILQIPSTANTRPECNFLVKDLLFILVRPILYRKLTQSPIVKSWRLFTGLSIKAGLRKGCSALVSFRIFTECKLIFEVYD